MQNPKYQRVRTNLDRLKFTENLHPDNVDLVDKILIYIEDLIKTIDKQKRKKNKNDESTLSPHHTGNSVMEIANLQQKLDLLNQKYQTSKQQNENLKKQLNNSSITQKIRSLQNKLRQCQSQYQTKVDSLSEQVIKYEQKIQQLTYSAACLQKQNKTYQGKLQVSSIQANRTTEQLTSLLQKKKKYIVKLQEQSAKYRIQVNSLQMLYEQQKQNNNGNLNGNLDRNKQANNKIVMVLRQEVSELEDALADVRTRLEKEQQKNSKLKDNNTMLNQQIGMLKNQQNYAKQSCQLQNNAKAKMENMLVSCQQQNIQLKDKIAAIQQIRTQNQKQIQRQQKKIKQLSDKNAKIMNNSNRLQEQLTILNENYTLKIRELRQAQNCKVSFDRKIRELEITVKSYEQEQPNKQQMSSKNLENQYKKNLSTLQNQHKLLQNQLTILHQTQQKLLNEKSRLEIELKKQRHIMQQGSKQSQYLQTQKQQYQKQNKQLKQTLEELNKNGYSTKNQQLRQLQKLQSYQICMEELRVNVRNEQNINAKLRQQINTIQKTLQDKDANSKSLVQQNKQLTLRLIAIQKLKNQLFEKYNRSRDQKVQKDTQSIQSVRQYNQLMDEKKQIARKLRDKQRALIDIDNQRDQLQNILDDKTIQNTHLHEKVNKLEKQLQSYGKGMNQRQMGMQGMQGTIKTLQYQLQKTQKTISRLNQQLNQCQMQLNSRNLHIQELNNQINILVLNNKDQQKNIEKYRQKIEDLQRRLKDKNLEIDSYRQNIGIYKIQNENLTEEVQKQKSEGERWYNYAQQAGQENNNMFNKLTQKDYELKQLSQALRTLQFEANQQSHEINNYQKQLRQLGQQICNKNQQLDRLQDDRNAYRAQVNNSRRNIPTIDWKIHLQARLDQVQNDYLVKKMQCQNLRKQCRNLENVIEQQRYNSFMLGQKLQKMQELSAASLHKTVPRYKMVGIDISRQQSGINVRRQQSGVALRNGAQNVNMTNSLLRYNNHNNHSNHSKSVGNNKNTVTYNQQQQYEAKIQTPIKMFQKSQASQVLSLQNNSADNTGQHYEQYGDDDQYHNSGRIQHSSVQQINVRNNHSLSNSSQNSYDADKASIDSKQMGLNLAQIQRQYNQTLFLKKK